MLESSYEQLANAILGSVSGVGTTDSVLTQA